MPENESHFDPDLVRAAKKAGVILSGPQDKPSSPSDPEAVPPMTVFVDDFLVSAVIELREPTEFAVLRVSRCRAQFFELALLDPLCQGGPMGESVQLVGRVLWFFHYIRRTPDLMAVAEEAGFRQQDEREKFENKYRAWKHRQIARPSHVVDLMDPALRDKFKPA